MADFLMADFSSSENLQNISSTGFKITISEKVMHIAAKDIRHKKIRHQP
jgi:hypothetical protein